MLEQLLMSNRSEKELNFLSIHRMQAKFFSRGLQ